MIGWDECLECALESAGASFARLRAKGEADA